MSDGLHMWIADEAIEWSEASQVCSDGSASCFPREREWGYGRRLSRSCCPQELELPTLFTHTVWVLKFRVGAVSFNRFRVGAVASVDLVFFVFVFRRRWLGNPKRYPEWLYPVLVWGECFSCVTRYLIVWPFLGVFPFSTMLAVQWEHDVWVQTFPL